MSLKAWGLGAARFGSSHHWTRDVLKLTPFGLAAAGRLEGCWTAEVLKLEHLDLVMSKKHPQDTRVHGGRKLSTTGLGLGGRALPREARKPSPARITSCRAKVRAPNRGREAGRGPRTPPLPERERLVTEWMGTRGTQRQSSRRERP
jgi:hypothetical protein